MAGSRWGRIRLELPARAKFRPPSCPTRSRRLARVQDARPRRATTSSRARPPSEPSIDPCRSSIFLRVVNRLEAAFVPRSPHRAEPLNRLHITPATPRDAPASGYSLPCGARRRAASQDHFVKIPFSSALDHSSMINGDGDGEIRKMENAWRRPRADTGSFSVVAADRIGGDPRQLDLWPSPPSRNGAFRAVQAALDGWTTFKQSTDTPQPESDRSAQAKFLLLDSGGIPAPKPAPARSEVAVADRDEFVATAPSI